jgi:hypothetical protein
MSADRDRDSTQRTTAPAGVLGGPGKQPESAPKPDSGEKRVPKSAFAQTIAGIQVQNVGAPTDGTPEAEPLREPSDRPAPTPYNRPHGAWGGTKPMPDAVPPGNRSEERMIAAKPPQQPTPQQQPVPQQPSAPTRSPAAQYIKPGATIAMPTRADDAVNKTPSPARTPQAPQSPQPKGMPTQVLGTPAAGHVISPAPPPPSRSERAPAPKLTPGAAPRIQATGPAPASDASQHSQPLSLSLHARDHLESAGPAQPPTSKTPLWILASVGVVVVVGVLIWLFRPSQAPAPAPVPPATAVAPPVTPEPLPSTALDPTPPVQAATPEPTPAPAAPVVKPEPPKMPAVEKTASAPRPKAAAKKKKKVVAVKEGPVLQVKPSKSAATEDDLEKAARAAERLAEENDAPPSPDEPPSPDGE